MVVVPPWGPVIVLWPEAVLPVRGEVETEELLFIEADLPRGPVTAPLLAALPWLTLRVPVIEADFPLLPVKDLLTVPCTGGFLRCGCAQEFPHRNSGKSKASNHTVIRVKLIIFLL